MIELTSPTVSPTRGQLYTSSEGRLVTVGWSGQTTSYSRSRKVALLEGLERQSGTTWPTNDKISMSSLSELGDAAVDPRSSGEYDATTYAQEGHLQRFDPDARIRWIRAAPVGRQAVRLVPAQTVFYSRRLDEHHFVDETSNGCATGATMTEATLFGLLELIERDAFLLGWYRAASLPRIDMSSLRRRSTRLLARSVERLGFDVLLLDNRIDLGIPVITAIALPTDPTRPARTIAACCALDPEDAAAGAVEEIATYVPQIEARVVARDRELGQMLDDFSRCRELPDHAELGALPEMEYAFAHYVNQGGAVEMDTLFAPWREELARIETTTDAVSYVSSALRDRGIDPLVVDLTTSTQASQGLRSARAIGPGLIPMDFGWHRRRAFGLSRVHRAFEHPNAPTPGAEKLVPHPFP